MAKDLAKLRAALLAEDPSPQQRAAIFADEKEFILRASPGSGKTWTSCRRFIWRLENRQFADCGMALLSFTNRAVLEFEKAARLTNSESVLSDPNFLGTFDSFIERFIITPFGHLLSGGKKRPKLFVGPRPGDRNNRDLRVSVVTKNGKSFPVFAWEIVPIVKSGGIAFISAESRLPVPNSLAFKVLNSFFVDGFYTHAQRSFWACALTVANPRIAEILATRFTEFIVDEAQDTGAWQVELLRKLRNGGANVTLVGDPDQCIFEFSLASVSTLKDLRQDWKIPELPLDKSYRCNDAIANSVKLIGSNPNFQGCGAPINRHAIPYIIGDGSGNFANSIAFFKGKLADAGIAHAQAAIISRGHDQILRIGGSSPFTILHGKARELAQSAYDRDVLGDLKSATERIYRILRGFDENGEFSQVTEDAEDSEKAQNILLHIWKFVRDANRLPALTDAADVWLAKAKVSFGKLLAEVGISTRAKMGLHLNCKGLNDQQLKLPLHAGNENLTALRMETIHKVKGEGIDAVLLVGSEEFFDSVVKSVESNADNEQRRLCYVAMTRAKHLLVVATPNAHYARKKAFWTDRNFAAGN